MKTGIELIQQERNEQKNKHGYTKQHDYDTHEGGQLKKAALYALTYDTKYEQDGFKEFESKMEQKSKIERLVIAAALLAAEIDRIQGL